MSVKIKDAELISEVSEEIMIPVGNTGEEGKAQAVKVSQLVEKVVGGLSTVATSGSYNDLSNKPTVPSKTSQLTNDSNYTTKAYVDGLVGTINNTLETI